MRPGRFRWVTMLAGMLAATLGAGQMARAADDVVLVSVDQALSSGEARGKLDGTVKFFFGSQKAPPVAQSHGLFTSNQKTNAFNKTEGDACTWVFLSAMVSLQDRAKSLGADAVINIQSYYRKVEFTSDSQFECHKGALMAGVALRGEVVRTAGTAPPPGPGPGRAGATGAGSGDTAARLKELDRLREQKLISPAEYEQKRKAILNAL